MSLFDFFSINCPYGLIRNDKGEWAAFNREYVPLGFNQEPVNRSFVYTRYKGLSESILLKIAENGAESVNRDEEGKICRVWLYDDRTNTMGQRSMKNVYWQKYWEKLEILSKLSIDI